MRISPADIRRKEFSRGMRGYADAEVDAFLDEVANDLERGAEEQEDRERELERERAREVAALKARVGDLTAKVDELGGKLAEYERIADALPKALIAAQASAEEVRQNAVKAAQIVLRDAEAKARQIVSASYTERQAVEQANLRLRAAESEFRQRFRTMLEGYLQIADQSEAAAPPLRDLTELRAQFAHQGEVLREALADDEHAERSELAAAEAAPEAQPAPAAAQPGPAVSVAGERDDLRRAVPPPAPEGDVSPDTTMILDRHVDAIKEALAREEAAQRRAIEEPLPPLTPAPAQAAPAEVAPAEVASAAEEPNEEPAGEEVAGGTSGEAQPAALASSDDVNAHVTGEVKAHEFKW